MSHDQPALPQPATGPTAPLPAQEPRPAHPTQRNILYSAVLGALLAAALYLRTAGLGEVQGFNGDQGRDYLEVMHWLQDGRWPLLGPLRVTGDFTLGPGWFYTLAPAMALSGFHPAAGAATVAGLAVLMILLAADWIRRATGSRAAALVTAAVFTFSEFWIETGRGLWSPHLMPLGVAGLAWLIAMAPRRPLPSLAAALGLMAILPQWHTPGLLVDAAAAGPLALAAVRGWPAARAARRAAWIAWGGALLAFVGLLYVPPLLYELRPGPGNLASFFSRSVLEAQPLAGGWGMRALLALDKLVSLAFQSAFAELRGWRAFGELAAPALALGWAAMAAAAWVWLGDLRRRSPDLAAGMLALLAGGFWLVLALKGRSVQEYFLMAPLTALLLLGGWAAGRLLTAPLSGARIQLKHLAGTALLLTMGALTLAQLPRGWGVHQGATRYGFSFKVAREVAEAIAADSAGRPYSVELAEMGNFAAHYIYLLRRLGRAPLNEEYYAHAIAREKMGEQVYIIVAPGMQKAPVLLDGIPAPLEEPLAVRNLFIYRIDPRRLPPQARRIKIEVEGLAWGLVAEEQGDQ